MNREELVEAVTKEVLAALADSTDPDADCEGACAAHSPDKVRDIVANGADRNALKKRLQTDSILKKFFTITV